MSLNGGETKDANPPGVGGGHGGEAGRDYVLLFWGFFLQMIFFFGGSFSEVLLEGIFG